MGVAVVAPQAGQLTRVLHRIERWVDARPEVEVLGTRIDHLEPSS